MPRRVAPQSLSHFSACAGNGAGASRARALRRPRSTQLTASRTRSRPETTSQTAKTHHGHAPPLISIGNQGAAAVSGIAVAGAGQGGAPPASSCTVGAAASTGGPGGRTAGRAGRGGFTGFTIESPAETDEVNPGAAWLGVAVVRDQRGSGRCNAGKARTTASVAHQSAYRVAAFSARRGTVRNASHTTAVTSAPSSAPFTAAASNVFMIPPARSAGESVAAPRARPCAPLPG